MRGPERFASEAKRLRNVDGLHLRAGSSPERCWRIHGDLGFLRCAVACGAPLRPMPDEIPLDWAKERAVGETEKALLRCAACGAIARPHVLWFDERYDEATFRAESSLRAAAAADVLLVIGTSGAASLPVAMAEAAAMHGAALVVLDAEDGADNPFAALARACAEGWFVAGDAAVTVAAAAAALAAGATSSGRS